MAAIAFLSPSTFLERGHEDHFARCGGRENRAENGAVTMPRNTAFRACERYGASYLPCHKLQRFCSHSCAFKSSRPLADFAEYNRQLGRKSAEKIGETLRGSGRGDGYVKRGGRHEHRVVMERELGRPLEPHEIVHHDDERKNNNAPSNLVLTDRVEHGRIHNLGRKRPPKTACKAGHPLTPDNVTKKRQCLICARKYSREWHRARRRARGLRRPGPRPSSQTILQSGVPT
jgi:hypothetical protein